MRTARPGVARPGRAAGATGYPSASHEFDTYSRVFGGLEICDIANHLVVNQVWFEVTPLGSNEWRISVKTDSKHVLENW